MSSSVCGGSRRRFEDCRAVLGVEEGIRLDSQRVENKKNVHGLPAQCRRPDACERTAQSSHEGEAVVFRRLVFRSRQQGVSRRLSKRLLQGMAVVFQDVKRPIVGYIRSLQGQLEPRQADMAPRWPRKACREGGVRLYPVRIPLGAVLRFLRLVFEGLRRVSTQIRGSAEQFWASRQALLCQPRHRKTIENV